MITLDVLQNRRDSLTETQINSMAELELLVERAKVIKKDIANIKGAIIEIDYLINSL